MRFQSYFNTAVLLIQQYDGSLPLVHFLKQYFAQHKKHGSKDRKLIAQLCYSYYRLGYALKENTVEERLQIALFVCNDTAGEWAILYDALWLTHWSRDLRSRIDFIHSVYHSFSVNPIFPWINELSDGINKERFISSHLVQPDLFLRIRPGKEKIVLKKLTEHQILFKQIGEYCLSLPNASKVDTILDIDREVVVQDYSSQRIADFLKLQTCLPHRQAPNLPAGQAGPKPVCRTGRPQTEVWDCCAASGGKSILAKDVLTNIELTVSDIRPAILRNLKERFERAGIKNYHSFIADLTNSKFIPPYAGQNSKFKIILCDAPCSGSGTWSRTPEQLCFFTDEKITEYAALQKKIVSNVIPKLAEDGYLLYITCSVFKKENEEVVAFIQNNAELKLVKMELLLGYDKKADSMFAALFKLID